jgi:CRP/FNR family transcriptional regulator, cyclic AMP receptor protein
MNNISLAEELNCISILERQATMKDKLRLFLSRELDPTAFSAKNIPFLSSLSEQALLVFEEKATILKYPKLAVIISEGDVANAFFIILSGKVRAFSSDYDKSKEITLMILEPGSCFGEIDLITREPRLTSIVALEKTACAVISKDDFNNWVMNYPDVAITLLRMLSGKIRQLTDKFTQMALSSVYERIVKTLQEIAVVEGNVGVIKNRPTQQDLAYMVGASREMVGKILHDLTIGGYVEIKNNTLIIVKKLPSSW